MLSDPRLPTPGPGSYNITSWRCRSTPSYSPLVILCFFQGADPCSACETLLYGDYYKNSSGKLSLCLECFRNALDPVRTRTNPGNFHKVRHCSAYHKHIGVDNIVGHKTTSRQVRRLGLMERKMWNKFGEIVDHKGKPV